jgi:hypothetical protein
VIRNFKKYLRQKRNYDSFSAAKLTQVYTNSKRDKDANPEPIEIVHFLPHPDVWMALGQKRKLKISRRVAISTLNTLDKLDDDIRDIVEVDLQELQLIANGD